MDFHIDKEALDEAFDELADEEGLTEDEKELLAAARQAKTDLAKTQARVQAVCADIVEHYLTAVAPLGLKAQVVAFDRELCVALPRRDPAPARRARTPGDGGDGRHDRRRQGRPAEWRAYDRDRDRGGRASRPASATPADPLKFLIVTAKLLTGFDAPIEGVMYLDKPLRPHTLFQALTRTNRRWTNPDTGQEKTVGLVVDYIGLGEEIARAPCATSAAKAKPEPLDVEMLKDELRASLRCRRLERFEGIDLLRHGFHGAARSAGAARRPTTTVTTSPEFPASAGALRAPLARRGDP